MPDPVVLNMNMDERCAECRSKGAVDHTGLCIVCMAKVITGEPMKSKVGQAAQVKWKGRQANGERP